MNFDDVSYDEHAALLYGLAGQVVKQQKFDSDPERRFGVILENDAEVLK